jgi:hypothetical protein
MAASKSSQPLSVWTCTAHACVRTGARRLPSARPGCPLARCRLHVVCVMRIVSVLLQRVARGACGRVAACSAMPTAAREGITRAGNGVFVCRSASLVAGRLGQHEVRRCAGGRKSPDYPLSTLPVSTHPSPQVSRSGSVRRARTPERVTVDLPRCLHACGCSRRGAPAPSALHLWHAALHVHRTRSSRPRTRTRTDECARVRPSALNERDTSMGRITGGRVTQKWECLGLLRRVPLFESRSGSD